MSKQNIISVIPDEVVISKIYIVRGIKVMLDRDLAELYGIETKVLKQSVRRNIERFPEDFMFEMNEEELQNWRSQFVTSNSDKIGLRYPPFCFTEHGVLMLASVLNSDRAIQTNIQIVRIFTKMREMLQNNKYLSYRIEIVERKLVEHNKNILSIFKHIKQLENVHQKELKFKKRKKIGFKQKNE